MFGQSAVRAFTVTNTGDLPLHISKSQPPVSGVFAAVDQIPEGTTVAAGDSISTRVRFVPPYESSVLNDAWVINSDDGAGLHRYPLHGTGIAAPAPGPPVGSLTDPVGTSLGTVTPPPPPPHVVAVLSGLRIAPAAFRTTASGRGRHRKAPGATVRFALSAPASVRFAVRARRSSCPPSPRPCTGYRALKGGFVQSGRAGANALRFSGTLGGTRLAPGHYRLLATPFDGAQPGHARLASFTVR